MHNCYSIWFTWRDNQISLFLWINLFQTCLQGVKCGCGQTFKDRTDFAMGQMENFGDKGLRGLGIPTQAFYNFSTLNRKYKVFFDSAQAPCSRLFTQAGHNSLSVYFQLGGWKTVFVLKLPYMGNFSANILISISRLVLFFFSDPGKEKHLH